MVRLAVTLLEQKSLAFRLLMTEEEKAAARKNFESHFGRSLAINLLIMKVLMPIFL
jgi:hypothetical protein